jgi:hypothetical protein
LDYLVVGDAVGALICHASYRSLGIGLRAQLSRSQLLEIAVSIPLLCWLQDCLSEQLRR